jgi:hypothetical protein
MVKNFVLIFILKFSNIKFKNKARFSFNISNMVANNIINSDNLINEIASIIKRGDIQ